MNCLRRHACWQRKTFYWEGAPGWRAVGWGDPGELLCRMCHRLEFYAERISFRIVFGISFWLRVLPGGSCMAEPRWMPARRILEGVQTRGVSLWPFLNSSGWRWLVSSLFLTRTSCHKITCKWLLWCLGRVGGFSQCAPPNIIMPLP